jgi:hypothetical protein
MAARIAAKNPAEERCRGRAPGPGAPPDPPKARSSRLRSVSPRRAAPIAAVTTDPPDLTRVKRTGPSSRPDGHVGPRRGLLAREWCGNVVVISTPPPTSDAAWPIL